jgi:hypothetical protein
MGYSKFEFRPIESFRYREGSWILESEKASGEHSLVKTVTVNKQNVDKYR